MANISTVQTSVWVDQRIGALKAGMEWQPDISRGLARLRELRGGWRPARWMWTAGAATMACIVMALLPQPRVFAHYCLDCTVALWQNFSGLDTPAAKLETRRKDAADFTLSDAAGNPVQLSRLRGKVVLLNFWATWCQGCKIEIPWFIEFQKKYKDKGLEVVGVSMDDDGWKAVTPYIEEKKVNYTVVIGNEEVGARFGVGGMPVTLLIDRDGKVAAAHSGLVKRTDYRKEIELLLEEKH
jgi:peroxiredoxin